MVRKYTCYKIDIRYMGIWRQLDSSYKRKRDALLLAKRLRKAKYTDAVHVMRKTTVFETVAKF